MINERANLNTQHRTQLSIEEPFRNNVSMIQVPSRIKQISYDVYVNTWLDRQLSKDTLALYLY